ncbi:hypothetical protein ABT340_39570 [Streptosporangium sp. NPDC000239]|uniref:hypothetical protein n=1 Tax=Streptosporangium sp. NPDC000239 TaxID=3154248 RepID=UPI0033204742
MWNLLLPVIVGGALSLVGGVVGQVYAARSQVRYQQRLAEVTACEELYAVLGKLRTEQIEESLYPPARRRDPRPFEQQEMEDSEVNDSLERPCARIRDRELRAAIRQYATHRGPLTDPDQHIKLLELLQERCGGVMRGDKRLVDLSEVHQATQRKALGQ